ncbi:hypothetical protein BMF94_4096 [Rhodotorula taiwanensis]|uniref:Actin-like ATPase domain-containing protein n=1 Tax=Rhodotorula taiwanensis TaxID=741276 RepID=A0A2S5B7Y7_9BASI|nr:hypothetical protein BMF94_4096 [Rhodotorula taiwanensis]
MRSTKSSEVAQAHTSHFQRLFEVRQCALATQRPSDWGVRRRAPLQCPASTPGGRNCRKSPGPAHSRFARLLFRRLDRFRQTSPASSTQARTGYARLSKGDDRTTAGVRMVKAYQEIVRASSRRDPASGRGPPPLASASGASTTPSNSLAPPVASTAATSTHGDDTGGPDEAEGTAKKGGRFRRLARLQIGSSSKDKGKGKDKELSVGQSEANADSGVPPALGKTGVAGKGRRTTAQPPSTDHAAASASFHPAPSEGASTYDPARMAAVRRAPPQQFLSPPPVGPNGIMYPPPGPMFPYPYPPYGAYPYGPYGPPAPPPPATAAPQRQHYHPHANGNGYASTSALPPLSAAASSSAAMTGTGASTSPTSPNTPTSAAHYYPYVASQPKRQETQNRDAMASPQSFKSRGSGGAREDGGMGGGREENPYGGIDGPGDEAGGDDEARESLGRGFANGYGTSAGSRVPSGSGTLPPGAAPPVRSPPSIAPSQRSGRSLAAPSHRSTRSRPNPSIEQQQQQQMAPYPSYPYPYPPPPMPGYPPPPMPPYGYPGYPPYGPMPPPHLRLAPPSPAPTSSTARGRVSSPPPPPANAQRRHGPGSTASESQTSLAMSTSRQPPPPQSYPYPYPYPPPPPLSAAAAAAMSAYGGSTYDPAVYAVAQNMERERLRLRTDLGPANAGGKGKERERAGTIGSVSVNGGRGLGRTQAQREEEGKMSVGIDFGTTFSGIAYGSARVFDGQIRQILNWPGSYETYRKVPTCILYEQHDPSEEAKIVSWGLEAKNTTVREGFVKCEWFKLLLSPESLRSGVPDPWLPPLPAGKNVVDVIADFLRCIWRYARRVITEEIGSVVDLNAADVLLTVPAAWDAAACSLMRESALRAGLVQSSRGGDTQWRDRLQIITEPEAGAIHASTLATLHHLRPSQSFLLCDAGGGTVDTAVYKLMGQLSELEIAEMCVRSGANTGSLFVDLKFEELLRRILKDHPVHLEPASMATFIHAFAEGDKLAYHGTAEDDEAIFRFNCFNVEDSHDPSVGLEYGELAIPGKMLKTEVFDPIIDQVLELLSTQIAKIGHTSLDAIILVGGFSASEYLYTRVRQAFGADVPVVVRPQDCDTATLRGAARYGLGLRMGRGGVSSVISPRSYCMKSKLPAEEEDHWRRPEYVTTNDGGTVVCENRLSYLIAKGAVLRKGERLRSRFCKFIKDPHDSVFTAHLFVSNSEELYRYTDEGDLAELCRWTVDLGALPRFRELERTGGGYIEFDLGLQLDSAEVRGVLMTEDGIECGAATFEFLGT